jgi:hypothetical protein
MRMSTPRFRAGLAAALIATASLGTLVVGAPAQAATPCRAEPIDGGAKAYCWADEAYWVRAVLRCISESNPNQVRYERGPFAYSRRGWPVSLAYCQPDYYRDGYWHEHP